ncbi:Stealth CR1 domain-containing protein [Vibrio splendidus]|uniref:Stealth CR1 domain-containing protein n=1 Tax=Vibrio splendidus TaxID=29497 RepID=UPI0013010931|nr:Stealth CR1 domain-containing protein [Vibrio splendidus]
MSKINDIDIVLLWVDSKDPKWQKLYDQYSPQRVTTANHICRFRSWDNLQYIFRGIEEFMPWVRKVHFVTQGHLPEWLNKSESKLNVLTHHDIFKNHNHLPTFNSNAIEANFNNIPDLAEKFILFNDDFFVLKPLNEDRFFREGVPVDFLVQSFQRRGKIYNTLKPKNTLSAKAINNNIDYLNDNYNKRNLDSANFYSSEYKFSSRVLNFIYNLSTSNVPWLKLNHVPQPHLKSTLDELWDNNFELLDATCSHKFRVESDTTQYLFRYINLLTGKFYPKEYQDYISREINETNDMSRLLTELDDINLLSVSDTENLGYADFDEVKNIFNHFLFSLMPKKSRFER